MSWGAASAQSGCLIATLATVARFGLVLGGEFPTAKPCCWKGRRIVRDAIAKGTVNGFPGLSTPFTPILRATWVLLHKGTAPALMGNELLVVLIQFTLWTGINIAKIPSLIHSNIINIRVNQCRDSWALEVVLFSVVIKACWCLQSSMASALHWVSAEKYGAPVQREHLWLLFEASHSFTK